MRCRKKSQRLGLNWSRGVPIEVLPMAYRLVKENIEDKIGGEAVLREAKAKAVEHFYS
jgi:ribose 5-phosphate isomerase A